MESLGERMASLSARSCGLLELAKENQKRAYRGRQGITTDTNEVFRLLNDVSSHCAGCSVTSDQDLRHKKHYHTSTLRGHDVTRHSSHMSLKELESHRVKYSPSEQILRNNHKNLQHNSGDRVHDNLRTVVRSTGDGFYEHEVQTRRKVHIEKTTELVDVLLVPGEYDVKLTDNRTGTQVKHSFTIKPNQQKILDFNLKQLAAEADSRDRRNV